MRITSSVKCLLFGAVLALSAFNQMQPVHAETTEPELGPVISHSAGNPGDSESGGPASLNSGLDVTIDISVTLNAPLLSLTAKNSSITEGEDAVFTVESSLFIILPFNISANFTGTGNFLEGTTGETGVSVNNFTFLGTQGELTASTVDDFLAESDGTITATLVDGEYYNVDPANSSATITVQDNDSWPVVSISGGASVTEGQPALFSIAPTFSTAISGAGAFTLTVSAQYSQTGDFMAALVAPRVALTFDVGENQATLSVPTVDDNMEESDGSITVTLVAGNGYTVDSSNDIATVNVLDNDDPPVFSMSGPVDVTEGQTAIYTVVTESTLDAQMFAVVSHTATGDFYYERSNEFHVTFPSGADRGYMYVPTIDDKIDEENGIITATIDSVSVGTISATGRSVTTTVKDNDEPLPVVSITGDSVVTEGEDAVFSVTANQLGSDNLTVSVQYSQLGEFILPGTATEVSLTFYSGTTQLSLTVPTEDDSIDEEDGSISATFVDPDGYTIDGWNRVATITVLDNDESSTTPVISIRAIGGVITEGESAGFRLVSEEHSPGQGDLEINVRIDELGDFLREETTLKTVDFEYGDTTTQYATDSFWLPTVDDDDPEPDGSIAVTVVEGEGYEVVNRPENSPHIDEGDLVRVLNNDVAPATLSLSASSQTVEVGESASLFVHSTTSSFVTASMRYTFRYVDGSALFSFLTVKRVVHRYHESDTADPGSTIRLLREWTPSANHHSFTIEILPGETLDGTRFDNGGNRYSIAEGAGSVTVTVEREVPEISISTSAAKVDEGNQALFTVTSNIELPYQLPVSIQTSGTASSADGDFIWNESYSRATLNFAVDSSGNYSTLLVVDTVDDAFPEPDETITLTLVESEGYTVGTTGNSATVTILNNDILTTPVISIRAIGGVITEGESAGFRLVSEGHSPGQGDLEINVKIDELGDFLKEKTVLKTVDFEYGDTTTQYSTDSFWLPTVDDDEPEPDGSIAATVVEGEGYEVVNRSENSPNIDEWDLVRVLNNDVAPATLSLSASTLTVEEGESASLFVHSTSSSFVTASMRYTFRYSDGSAPFSFLTVKRVVHRYHESDTADPGSTTRLLREWTPSANHHSFTIEILPGDTLDGTRFDNGGNSYSIAEGAGSVTVTVDRDLPEISISADSTTVREGEEAAFTLTSNKPVQNPLPVSIQSTGIASAGEDFIWDESHSVPAGQALLSFADSADGNLYAPFVLRTVDDTLPELNEKITLAINGGDGYSVSSTGSSASITILDNDSIPTVSFLSVTSLVPEGSSVGFTVVSDTEAASSGLSVSVNASQTGDFLSEAAGTRSVTIPTGGRFASYQEFTVDDEEDEPNGTVNYTIMPDSGYEIGSVSTLNIIITDNDEPASKSEISISAVNPSVSEGEPAEFRLTASPAQSSPIAVSISLTSVHNSHEETSTRTVVIPADEKNKVFPVATPEDDMHGTTASVSAEILTGSGYGISVSDSEATVTVTEDDPEPSISISVVTESVTEGDQIWFLISADRASVNQKSINVTVTDSDGDFLDTDVPEGAKLWAGYSVVYLRVQTVDDETDEADGEVTVTLGNGVGYTVDTSAASASAGVLDDDVALPVASIAPVNGPSISEGTSANFTVSTDVNTTVNTDIMIRITQDGDYFKGEVSGTVRIAESGNSGFLVIQTDDDEIDETDGSITVEILAGEGYTVASSPNNAASIAVTDNDVPEEDPTISITAVSTSIQEGETASFGISTEENVKTDLQIIVLVGIKHGSASETLTIEKGKNAVNLPVQILDDELFGGDARIIATLQDGPGYKVDKDKNSATVTVVDDESEPEISVEAITATVVEGSPVWLMFKSSPASVNKQTVSVSITESVGNYLKSEAPEFVEIQPFYRMEIVSLETEDDDVFEGDGSIDVAIQNGDGYEVASKGGSASVNVRDNDRSASVPTVSVSNIIESMEEGGNAIFRVTSTMRLSNDITVNLRVTLEGEFISGVTPSTVRILKHNTIGLVLVGTSDDDVDEADGSITVELLEGTGYEVATGSDARSTVTVEDNDEQDTVPDITIYALSTAVAEGGDAEFGIYSLRTVDEDTSVRVDLTTGGGFFSVGTDGIREIVIEEGTFFKSFSIRTLGDDREEADGSIAAEIEADDNSPASYNVGSPSTATVNVTDDDGIPTVSIASVASTLEESDTAVAEFTITSTKILLNDLTVFVDVQETGSVISGTVPETVILESGETSVDFEISLSDDKTNEATSRITAIIEPRTDYNIAQAPGNSAYVDVTDNDQYVLRAGMHMDGRRAPWDEYEGALPIEGLPMILYFNTEEPYGTEVSRDITVNFTATDTQGKLISPPTKAVIKAGKARSSEVMLPTSCNEIREPASTITVKLLPGDGYVGQGDGTFTATLNDIEIGSEGKNTCPGPRVISISSDKSEITEGESFTITITPDGYNDGTYSVFVDVTNEVGNFVADTSRREIEFRDGSKPESPKDYKTLTITAQENGVVDQETGVIKVSVVDTDDSIAGPSGTVRVNVLDKDSEASPSPSRSAALHRSVLPDILVAFSEQTVNAVSSRIDFAFNNAGQGKFELAGAKSFEDLVKLSGELMNDEKVDLSGILSDSSFALPLIPDGDAGSVATLWGSGFSRDVSGDGSESSVDWNGDTFSGHLGLDAKFGSGLLAGMAASSNESSVDFKIQDGQGDLEGLYRVRMTSLQPYFGWSNEDLSTQLRASAGYGLGEVEIDYDNSDPEVAASRKYSLLLGGTDSLYSSESLLGGSSELKVKSDAWMAGQSIKGNGRAIAGAAVDIRSMRVVAEGTHQRELVSGAQFTPSATLGARWNGGDKDTGLGIELSGSTAYENPMGLGISGSGRMFASDDTGNERGIKGELNYDHGFDGIGLITKFSPAWGVLNDNGIQKIWNEGVSTSAFQENDAARLEARIGYGIGILEWSMVMSPYLSTNLSEDGLDRFGIGSQLLVGEGVNFKVEGIQDSLADGVTDRKVELEGSLEW